MDRNEILCFVVGLFQVSAVQQDVYNTLTSMGYKFEMESTICGLPIDMSLADKALAIEVDGPTHFCRNAHGRVVGNSLWKRRLLNASGWAIVNVDASELNGFRRPADRRKYLEKEIEAAFGEVEH